MMANGQSGGVSSNHPRDTRFMRQELCAEKRLLGAFQMDWAGYRLNCVKHLFQRPSVD
jgi:hypothetical protein